MEQPLRLVKDDGEGGKGKDNIPNPFAFDTSSAYDRDKFYTRATDGNGVGETVYFKCNPNIMAGIADLVASRQIPEYKSTADYIRNAIVHALHYDSERIKDGRLTGLVNRTVMLARVQSRQTELAELKELMGRHEEAMQTCVDHGDKELLADLINDADHDIEELREAYKRQLTVVVEKFRKILAEME